MTTDRELLEWAAKAAELKEWGWMADTLTHVVNNQFVFWEPLTDDGDALRLAVKLRLALHYEYQLGDECVEVNHSHNEDDGSCQCVLLSLDSDPRAATRRAIVRSAAEIGRTM